VLLSLLSPMEDNGGYLKYESCFEALVDSVRGNFVGRLEFVNDFFIPLCFTGNKLKECL